MANKLLEAVNKTLEWIMWTVWLHLLWVAFTVSGLVVFGWMPATLALFAVWRKLLLHREEKLNIFRLFYTEFKQHFIKKNLIGVIFMISFLIIYVDVLFYQYLTGVYAFLFLIVLIPLFIVAASLYIYFPAVYAHFQLSMKDYFKQAVVFGFASPLASVSITIFIVAAGFVYYQFPFLFIIFGISPLGVMVMKISLIRFRQLRLEEQ